MKAHQDIQLVVSIRPHFRMGQRQAQDKLVSWLETYGYTSTGHGFDFIDVGVIGGKRLANAPSKESAK